MGVSAWRGVTTNCKREEMGRILVVLTLLLGLCALCRAQTASGSGSGNGTVEEMRNCSSLGCSHGCNETTEGPMCYCPSGYSLSAADMMTCQPCLGGLYGVNCASTCDCGNTGNTCNRTNGACICNQCYTGTQCGQSTGSHECFVQFLEIVDKSRDVLRNIYGEVSYPQPPDDQVSLQRLAAELMDTVPSLASDAEFSTVSRMDVGQGPLVKLSWYVDRSGDASGAEQALMNLSNKVKLGSIRATYIAQESTDTNRAFVTLNSGVKEEPN